MEPRASGEGVGERGWVRGPYLKRAPVRESQGFSRKNKETIVWKRSERKIWQRLLNAEKLYGLTSWLIHWIVLKITWKGTPSQYTEVPTYFLAFLLRVSRLMSHKWPRLTVTATVPVGCCLGSSVCCYTPSDLNLRLQHMWHICQPLTLVTWWSVVEWCVLVLE